MSTRQRGSDVFVTIIVDGVKQRSMDKLKDFRQKLRGRIIEEDYVGEPVTDLDTQYDGFDLDWTYHLRDAAPIELLDKLVERDRNHQQPPDVQIQIYHRFRDPAVRNRVVTYFGVKLMPDEENLRDRKEYIEGKFTAKSPRRTTVMV